MCFVVNPFMNTSISINDSPRNSTPLLVNTITLPLLNPSSKSCSQPGCRNLAKAPYLGELLCIRHGGGRRCDLPDCPRSAQTESTMCAYHTKRAGTSKPSCDTCFATFGSPRQVPLCLHCGSPLYWLVHRQHA